MLANFKAKKEGRDGVLIQAGVWVDLGTFEMLKSQSPCYTLVCSDPVDVCFSIDSTPTCISGKRRPWIDLARRE